jgi:hypothetical protein
MKYTKSDLGSETGEPLFEAIIQVGKELDKKDTLETRRLAEKLLSNFNKYDKNQLSRMFNDFQRFLEKCVNEEEILDLEYVVEHNHTTLEEIIMGES